MMPTPTENLTGLASAANERIQKAPLWATIFGILMILFGWIYPHFLEDGSWLKYLYASPMGLIPCPTLSFTIGFAMLANGFSSRLWSVILVTAGLFYSLFDALRLGVQLDFVLLAGALLLLVQWLASRSSLLQEKRAHIDNRLVYTRVFF